MAHEQRRDARRLDLLGVVSNRHQHTAGASGRPIAGERSTAERHAAAVRDNTTALDFLTGLGLASIHRAGNATIFRPPAAWCRKVSAEDKATAVEMAKHDGLSKCTPLILGGAPTQGGQSKPLKKCLYVLLVLSRGRPRDNTVNFRLELIKRRGGVLEEDVLAQCGAGFVVVGRVERGVDEAALVVLCRLLRKNGPPNHS